MPFANDLATNASAVPPQFLEQFWREEAEARQRSQALRDSMKFHRRNRPGIWTTARLHQQNEEYDCDDC